MCRSRNAQLVVQLNEEIAVTGEDVAKVVDAR